VNLVKGTKINIEDISYSKIINQDEKNAKDTAKKKKVKDMLMLKNIIKRRRSKRKITAGNEVAN